jgi:hypothetical protein
MVLQYFIVFLGCIYELNVALELNHHIPKQVELYTIMPAVIILQVHNVTVTSMIDTDTHRKVHFDHNTKKGAGIIHLPSIVKVNTIRRSICENEKVRHSTLGRE